MGVWQKNRWALGVNAKNRKGGIGNKGCFRNKRG
jgi:hypothetical protein